MAFILPSKKKKKPTKIIDYLDSYVVEYKTRLLKKVTSYI